MHFFLFAHISSAPKRPQMCFYLAGKREPINGNETERCSWNRPVKHLPRSTSKSVGTDRTQPHIFPDVTLLFFTLCSKTGAQDSFHSLSLYLSLCHTGFGFVFFKVRLTVQGRPPPGKPVTTRHGQRLQVGKGSCFLSRGITSTLRLPSGADCAPTCPRGCQHTPQWDSASRQPNTLLASDGGKGTQPRAPEPGTPGDTNQPGNESTQTRFPRAPLQGTHSLSLCTRNERTRHQTVSSQS